MSRTDSSGQDGCTCPYTDPSTWLSAASCGYGGGYEPGSTQEWDPDCPEHPATPTEETAEVADEDRDAPEYDNDCAAAIDLAGFDPAPGWDFRRGVRSFLTSDWLRDHDAALTANAKAEVDDLRARLARVEALADMLDRWQSKLQPDMDPAGVARMIRASLASPATEEPA